MNDDSKPLTKKDLLEALKELDGLREYIHDTEIRILKAFHALSTANEVRLEHLEHFAATAGKRLANLETSDRLAELGPRVAEIQKKLDRPQ
jgi:hypothetical protein